MNKSISQLHHITSVPEQVQAGCEAGIDWVQLRVKDRSYNDWLNMALKAELICRKFHAKLIINDDPAIAKAAKADGVHLGKTDMDPAQARKLLGDHAIIGGTANTTEDIERLWNAGVDYIGVGPFRFTSTKKNLSPILGLEGYERIAEYCAKKKIAVPLIAIGGILTEDIKPILASGMYGIAVSAAINDADNRTEVIKKMQNKIKHYTHK
jgi:thiamine-phosphate pyrophosphorylase